MAKKICVAPGHGGFDPGAQGNGLVEKDLNLTICLELENLLRQAGVPVVMTRTTDVAAGGARTVNDDLHNQVLISDSSGAELFFSVHINSGGGNGAEIYVYKDGGTVRNLAQAVVDSIGPIMGVHGQAIKDGSGLYVIRNTIAPSMLLEIGFIDSSDADMIKQHLHDFAPRLAAPLIQWAGGDVALPVYRAYQHTTLLTDSNGRTAFTNYREAQALALLYDHSHVTGSNGYWSEPFVDLAVEGIGGKLTDTYSSLDKIIDALKAKGINFTRSNPRFTD